MKGPIAQVDWENSCLGPKALYRLPPSCIAEFLVLHELEGSLRSSGRGPLIIPGKSWFSKVTGLLQSGALTSRVLCLRIWRLQNISFKCPSKPILGKRKPACQTILSTQITIQTPLAAEQDRVRLSEWWLLSVGSSVMLLLLPCKTTFVKTFWQWYERLLCSSLFWQTVHFGFFYDL